jgi:hypothetical protein
MAQKFAVRHYDLGKRYEVYAVDTGSTHEAFEYTNESSRGRALGLANATRNDMNRDAAKDKA